MGTFNIKTLGCKVNQCDSQMIRERLLSYGFYEVSKEMVSDVSIINTCCVTSIADRKSRSAVRGTVKRKKKGGLVVVTGCYAGYDRPGVERIDSVDAIFDHSDRDKFFLWLAGLGDKFPRHKDGPRVLSRAFGGKTRAFLKIQDGCNNCCSYCIIPFVRGESRSRPVKEILEEVNIRSGEGFKEIVLTGVCLGSFYNDFEEKVDLVSLIEKIEKIAGIERIRLSSIEAADVNDRLIEKIGSSSKMCPHLHIPFQSGDDEVLAAMNKKLRVDDYKKIIEKAYKKIKNLAMTCDFIIGFPTEKERNFENTCKFIKFVKPLRVHYFTYSKRKGCIEFPHAISEKEIARRSCMLRELSNRLSLDFMSQFIGDAAEVLFEEGVDGWWQGYSRNYMKVAVKHKGCLGNSLAKVKLSNFAKDRMQGHLIDDENPEEYICNEQLDKRQ